MTHIQELKKLKQKEKKAEQSKDYISILKYRKQIAELKESIVPTRDSVSNIIKDDKEIGRAHV